MAVREGGHGGSRRWREVVVCGKLQLVACGFKMYSAFILILRKYERITQSYRITCMAAKSQKLLSHT